MRWLAYVLSIKIYLFSFIQEKGTEVKFFSNIYEERNTGIVRDIEFSLNNCRRLF